jgi:WhiB family redox-sensing transcriptional regulator
MAPQWFHDDPSKTAKCVLFPGTRDRDPWFGDSDDPEAADETDDAKSICNGTDDGKPCPMLKECLEFAMENNERYGIWGGMTPEERADLRKERKSWQRQSALVGDQN